MNTVPYETLGRRLAQAIQEGAHLSLLTACRRPDGLSLLTVLLQPKPGAVEVWDTPLPGMTVRSLTAEVPQAHWFERAVADMFGVVFVDHPRFKPLWLHEAWPEGFHPLMDPERPLPGPETPRREYHFMRVEGEGVYEIPVGPIHAGIIEPGHFRLSCLGEIIENLELRLGYQHRGVERQLEQTPWRRARFLAEAVSTDTTVGHALAHAWAVESMLGVAAPPQAVLRRGLALEIERIANHVGDVGGLCADVGYAGGATMLGRLRGTALSLAERLTGSRFMTAYIQPGGVSFDTPATQVSPMLHDLRQLTVELDHVIPTVLENPSVLERLEGIGRVGPSLARSFGMVGPAGRASGIEWDVRAALHQEPWSSLAWSVAARTEGDVLARTRIRQAEIAASLSLTAQMLERLEPGLLLTSLPEQLPGSAIGTGLVESWRGELLHLIATDEAGQVVRYAVKDPSFQNWTGVAIAVRGHLVSDFPLCNKSFSLSYSGNDL